MALAEFLRKITRLRVKTQNSGESFSTRPFSEAVQEAQLLLYFASRQGIKLENTIIAKVVEATCIDDGNTRDSQTTKQIEQEFWPAFQQLAETVKPVTIESIKAINYSYSTSRGAYSYWPLFNNKPLAQRSISNYSRFAVFTLLVVIAVQMYWVIGVSVTNETVNLKVEIESLKEQRLQRKNEINDDQLGGDNIYTALGAKITQNQQWLNAAHMNLKNWNRLWQAIANPLSDAKSYDGTTINTNIIRNRIAVTSAGFVLQALSTYILPLLYGLLGAFAYVLREIAKEVRTVTFSHKSCNRYRLRLALGLLAGIAVGFLVSPDTGQPMLTFATLGPLPFAFLAGYSVELVFAVMDKIVSAFLDERLRDGSGKPARDSTS